MKFRLILLMMLCAAPLSAQSLRPDPETLVAAGMIAPRTMLRETSPVLLVDRSQSRARGALIGGGIGLLLYLVMHSDADSGSGGAGVMVPMIGIGALIGYALGSNSAAQVAGQ